MEKESWSLAGLVVFLVFLILWQPQISWDLQEFLFGRVAPVTTDMEILAAENVALKVELDLLRSTENLAPSDTGSRTPGFVYSRYPFNFKNEMFVSVGITEGIFQDAGVYFMDFLIGKTTNIFDDSSVVRTVFDPRWQSPVRIGEEGIDALFVGGNSPRLTLIDKSAQIAPGDTVYNAAPDFSYGAPMAEVGEVLLSADQLFQEATLRFPYRISGVRTVTIAR